MNGKRNVPDYSGSEQPKTSARLYTQDHAPAQDTTPNSPSRGHAEPTIEFRPYVQQDAATAQTQAVADTSPLRTNANRPDTDFTISVDLARDTLAAAGFKRSKDTVQRYCRDGTLDARKLGMFSRFFIAPDSLDAFLEKMQLDASAKTDARSDVQVQEDAVSEETQDPQRAASEVIQAHTDASSDHADPYAGSNRRTQGDAQVSESLQLGDAVLSAKLHAAKDMIDRLTQENEFLRDEVRQSRQQREDVVDISKQMLNTLETMAVGRKLDTPSYQNQTVHAEVVRSTDREQEESATYASSDTTRSAGDGV